MMMILFPALFLGLLVALGVVFFQRRESLDLTPRGLLRSYLYLASFAGIVTLAIGLGSLTNYGLASAFGTHVIYGVTTVPMTAPACAPGDPRCPGFTPEQQELQRRNAKEQTLRRQDEDLLQGITFTAFGLLVWGAHWAARRGLGADGAGSGMRRAYFMLGTVTFGLVTVVMLPTGAYQALSAAVLPTSPFMYRQPADSLGGGLAALPIWLVFLRQLLADVRRSPAPA